MSAGPPSLTPRLVVADADAAIAFYTQTLGARCQERYAEPGGRVVHAALEVLGAVFSLTEAGHELRSPRSGSGEAPSLLLHLMVDDPDAVAAAMVSEGSTVRIPIEDRFYGRREGRVEDPFGHFWILSGHSETLTPEQVQRRMDDA